MKFGEILIEMGYISEEKLETALEEQKSNQDIIGYTETIGNILLRNGMISEEQLNEALIEYFKQQDLSENVLEKDPQKHHSKENLSPDSKMALINRIYDYQEKIQEIEKSIQTLKRFKGKPMILKQIENYQNRIKEHIIKIENIRNDLEKFS